MPIYAYKTAYTSGVVSSTVAPLGVESVQISAIEYHDIQGLLNAGGSIDIQGGAVVYIDPPPAPVAVTETAPEPEPEPVIEDEPAV